MNNNNFPSLLDRHFKMNQDYQADLVQDLLEQEARLELLPNYYELIQEGEVNPKMRTKLVEWMIQLADEIKLGYKTKQVSIIIVDLILSKLKIHKKYLQLLGITSIFITVKSEESFIYTLSHACEHCASTYTKEEISAMEMLILKTLKWKLQYPAAGEIARRLVQLLNEFLGLNLSKFFKKIDNFVDLAVSEFDSSVFAPSSVAAAAVMCAFENSTVHVEQWRKLMAEHFNFVFEGNIDVLYQNIIQKLLKFYPDYFNFPNTEDFQQADNGNTENQNTCSNMPASSNEHVNQMGQPIANQNQEMYAGMNMTAQQNGMETVNQNGYGLESGSQFGSPMKGGGRGMEEETY